MSFLDQLMQLAVVVNTARAQRSLERIADALDPPAPSQAAPPVAAPPPHPLNGPPPTWDSPKGTVLRRNDGRDRDRRGQR